MDLHHSRLLIFFPFPMLHWAKMNSLPIFFATNSRLMQSKDLLNIPPL